MRLLRKQGQVTQSVPKRLFGKAYNLIGGEAVAKFQNCVIYHKLWVLNTFSSGSIPPYGDATAKFSLVCFKLTRNGVFGQRLYRKFCRSQSG